MAVMECDHNTLQCYHLKYTDTNGATRTQRSCGDNSAKSNYATCAAKKAEAGCGKDGRVCFCRNCYGRLCNDSPMYKAATLQANTLVGSVSGLMKLMGDLSTLLRLGMFDVSLVTGGTTVTSNSTET